MSVWGTVDSSILSPWDELRHILSEHCSPPQKDRALQLLEFLLQDERRRLTGAELITGGIASKGFAVRPNGDITGPGHTSAFGDDGLGSNGVGLWGPSMGGSGGLAAAAWGKGGGVADIPLGGGMGPWSGDGLRASGAGWSFPGGNRVASGGHGGMGMDDEAAVTAALSGLPLDPSPGQPLGTWAPNPVSSFDLDPTPVQDSRLGSLFLPPAVGSMGAPGCSIAGQALPQPVPPRQPLGMAAAAAGAVHPHPQPPLQQLPPQPQLQLQPQPQPAEQPTGNTAVKFSSVVGGTASGRPQGPNTQA